MIRGLYFLIAVFALCLLPLSDALPEVSANTPRATMAMGDFSALPVLHEGRVKPLDSFARLYLRQLSGQDNYGKLSASQWLAETLFNPQGASRAPLLAVRDPEIIALLDLAARKSRLYSLDELAPGLLKTEKQVLDLATATGSGKELNPTEQNLLGLHEQALSYAALLKTLTPLLPLSVAVPESIILPEAPYFEEGPTWLELLKIENELKGKVSDTLNRKGENLDLYTGQEKAIAALTLELELLQRTASGNDFLKIIPSQWDSGQMWYAPPALLTGGHGSPQSLRYVMAWRSMAKAYLDGDQEAWQDAAREAFSMAGRQRDTSSAPAKLRLEVFYNRIAPFRLALLGYILSVILCLLHILKIRPVLYRGALIIAACSLAAHMAGIAMRIFILGRPPVGSLYESLLYVGVVVAAIALLIEVRRRDGRALLGSGITVAGLLLLAPVMAPSGDNLEMLVAVLNTNFWLATHVICITTGYGVCILSAVLAHLHLTAHWRGKEEKGVQGRMFRTIYVASLAALFFTAFGTILGGIWADQSWGRFWGWDPKENGALLIVLWIVWLHHGRLGGYLSPAAFVAGIAALNIIVALAWFGVNLLSVGLHSYGFTSGIAAGLGLFCAAELLLIGVLWRKAPERKAKEEARLCAS